MKKANRGAAARVQGFSLIELIVFIIVVGTALVGILGAQKISVGGSSDPLVRKQALTVAEMMLDQILAKDFQNDPADPANASATLGCTPTTANTCRVNTPDDLPNYNDVDDYNGWDQSNVYQQDGAINAQLADTFRVRVTVTPAMLNGRAVKRILVTVLGDFGPVELVGHRANY